MAREFPRAPSAFLPPPSPFPPAPHLERLLAISMAALGAMGALLLAMGQRNAVLPAAVLAAAIVSVLITDVAGWVQLPRRLGNLLAMLVALLCFWDFVRTRGELSALLGIADLLCYLQIILLFQKKDTGIYWSLGAVSLVEVLVAAAFSQGFLFGAVLAMYLFVGLPALALLFLHQQAIAEPSAETVPQANARRGRWPLAGKEPTFARATAGSLKAAVGGELLVRVSLVAFGSLGLAMVIFLVFPRLTVGAWRGRGGAVRTAVGFHDKVTLGELGRIIQNPQEVLRVELLDDATGQPYAVVPELYLRGAVLTDYARGQWEYRPLRRQETPRLLVPDTARPSGQSVRQQIMIEPMDRGELFCVWPFANLRDQPDLMFDTERERLMRSPARSADRFSFELWTPAFADARQSDLVPADFRIRVGELLAMPPRDGPGAVPGLIALAAQWVDEARPRNGDQYEIARVLERQLRESGRFHYSLEGQARDLAIDPIEDFILNHPQGHCEYFATALVLMLRSRRIPARMIVGYRGDEFNRLGRYYQVRQLHAHTWVEAYLEPGHVPSHRIESGRGEKWGRGAWLRLDPTPASDAAAESARVSLLSAAVSWLDDVWNSYVMDLDRPRQHEAIYRPLVEWVKAAGRCLSDPDWWRELLSGLVSTLDPGRWSWVGWRGAAAIALPLLFATLVVGATAQAWRRWRRRGGRGDQPGRRRRARIAFYRRLETVLSRRGFTRAAWQTQREFALHVGSKLAAAGQPQLADLPARVVEAFYAVRFGQRVLDDRQSAGVERALAELERAIPRSLGPWGRLR